MMEGGRENEEMRREKRRLQRKDGKAAGLNSRPVLISVCNKESETLGPREDMVH